MASMSLSDENEDVRCARAAVPFHSQLWLDDDDDPELMSEDMSEDMLLGGERGPTKRNSNTKRWVVASLGALAAVVVLAYPLSRSRWVSGDVPDAVGLNEKKKNSSHGHTLPAGNSTKLPVPLSKKGAESLLILAEMVEVVYDLDDHKTIQQRGHKYDKELWASGFVMKDCHQQQYEGDYHQLVPAHCIATREDPKEAVLVIKGTRPTSLGDIGMDIRKILAGHKPTIALAALGNEVEHYQARNYSVLVTGHSLGGYMAEVVATHYNLPGVAFNAPGPNGRRFHHTGDKINPDFQVVNAWEDSLGNMYWRSWFHAQTPIYVKGSYHQAEDLIKKLLGLKECMDITNVNVWKHVEEVRHQGQIYAVLGEVDEHPVPIEGSDKWYTCYRNAMHTCENQCCCTPPYAYSKSHTECTIEFKKALRDDS